MKRDGISIENEACASYVNMEQTGNMWELQEQDHAASCLFYGISDGRSFILFSFCIEGIEAFECCAVL